MTKKTMNAIMLEKKQKAIVPAGDASLPAVYVATALANIESLGFTFSPELHQAVATLTVEAFTSFYEEVEQTLQAMVGAHVEYTPLYPGFPSRLMDLDELSADQDIFFPFLDNVALKQIGLATEEDFYKLVSQLIGAKTSISSFDKSVIVWAIQQVEHVEPLLPADIPLKENVGFVVSTLLQEDKASAGEVAKYFSTATDVLRLAVALSDGDVSLAQNTRFKKFNRVTRRFLLELIDKCSNPTEDMLRYKRRWIALGEILHPGEYKSKYPKAYEAFDVLRNNKPFPTFNGKLEAAFVQKDEKEVLRLLSKRPGEFARRLDQVLRFASAGEALAAFAAVSDKVSTPVLLQVATHFKNRNRQLPLRTFFPKGNVGKMISVENTLGVLPEEICEAAVAACEQGLKTRFQELPELGNVWIDERLKEQIVPFSQRSANKSLRTLVRGSRVDIPEADVLRFFLWWKEGVMPDGKPTGTVDIDLSVAMYDEDWKYLDHVAFTNPASQHFEVVHSGDIRSAPKGAAEFIDVKLPSFKEKQGRYIVVSVNSYSHQAYSDLPECFVGWMTREDANFGKPFEPQAVQDKVDISSQSQVNIPMIVDVVERKAIWVDLSLPYEPEFHNTAIDTKRDMAKMGQALQCLVKPNLYDLFSLHAETRGTIVEAKEDAELIFSLEEGITPYEVETIMADYLV